MAPIDLEEIKAIIEMVNLPMQRALERALAGQDELRREFSLLSNKQAKLEERVVVAEEDAKELSEQMEDLKKAILQHQQKGFKRTIALQAAVLSAILLPAVGYIVTLILQSFHR